MDTTATVGVRPGFADDALDLIAGTDRNRRLCYDDGKSVESARDLARGIIDETQIREAVAATRRRTDRNEYRIGFGHRSAEFRRELQTAGTRVDRNHIVETRLIDRHLTARKRSDFLFILIDANDFVPEVGKTCARN